MELKTEFLCEMKITVGKTRNLGDTPHGNRRIVPVTGGTFTGEKLKGEVLPGGADWLCIRPDGATELDVRITLRTDDGHLVYVSYRGIIHVPPAVQQRIDRGEAVDPSEIYFRSTPVFETGSEKYGWLNRIIAVGAGRRTSAGIEYAVFAVL
ncbi:MAG TPA: DUF3237 domain-containing protein [Smithellaceae bacterium]|nr:DUF3237 domain-containing protein [Smithellaceae bacterium]